MPLGTFLPAVHCAVRVRVSLVTTPRLGAILRHCFVVCLVEEVCRLEEQSYSKSPEDSKRGSQTNDYKWTLDVDALWEGAHNKYF